MPQKLQIKRTSVSGRVPNTTNSGNTTFIDTGELALNLADGKLFTSNGAGLVEFGTGTPVYDVNGTLLTNTYMTYVAMGALTTNVAPATDNGINLGSILYRFNEGYFSNVFVGNTSVNTQLSGTTLKVKGKQAINGPAFGAYANNTTLQTITSGSQQKVLFQTEEFDTDNCYTNSRFTPTVEGYYQLNASVRLDGNTGIGETMIVIWKNGIEHKRGWNSTGVAMTVSSGWFDMAVSSTVYANGTTDYFEIAVQQTSGANNTVTAVANPAITWFNGSMVRGA